MNAWHVINFLEALCVLEALIIAFLVGVVGLCAAGPEARAVAREFTMRLRYPLRRAR